MAFHSNHKKKPEIFYRSSKTIQKKEDFKEKETEVSQKADKKKTSAS